MYDNVKERASPDGDNRSNTAGGSLMLYIDSCRIEELVERSLWEWDGVVLNKLVKHISFAWEDILNPSYLKTFSQQQEDQD